MSAAARAVQALQTGRPCQALAAPRQTGQRLVSRIRCSPAKNASSQDADSSTSRRQHLASLAGAAALVAAGSAAAPLAAHAQRFNDELVTSSSGLRIMDIKAGEGTAPKPGDV